MGVDVLEGKAIEHRYALSRVGNDRKECEKTRLRSQMK